MEGKRDVLNGDKLSRVCNASATIFLIPDFPAVFDYANVNRFDFENYEIKPKVSENGVLPVKWIIEKQKLFSVRCFAGQFLYYFQWFLFIVFPWSYNTKIFLPVYLQLIYNLNCSIYDWQ